MVVLEQPRCDQPVGGGVLGGTAEGVVCAVLPRAGERAVQDCGSGEVEWLVVVAQAAGDLAVIVLEVARFPRATQLGSWLGLVPSRQQSGETNTHGPITKTGSRYARRILVEAAWHYLREPRVGVTLAGRHPGPARPRAGDRVASAASLYRVHRRLRAHHKPPNVVTIACARELACFIWAAATGP